MSFTSWWPEFPVTKTAATVVHDPGLLPNFGRTDGLLESHPSERSDKSTRRPDRTQAIFRKAIPDG
jgi:hypothetical protein